MVYLERGAADGNGEDKMLTLALQKKYVKSYHTSAITQMKNASGYKKNSWKTRVLIDGKQKEVIRRTEAELYSALYEIYKNRDEKHQTLKDVFMMLCSHKQEHLARTEQTMYIDRKRFGLLSETLQDRLISIITAEDIQQWIVRSYLPTNPKPDALKKMLQLLGQIFEYAIEKDYCDHNPMVHVKARDYLGKCSTERKSEEEREFSEEELEEILEAAQKAENNVHALMIRVAMETGLRAGEIAALHKDDVKGDYIHVHRQQLRGRNEEGHELIYEVGYTKDERMNPAGGRQVPITPLCRKALDLALKLPGESEYLFHDENGQMAKKVSYEQYLNRLCTRLGTSAKHNHAFRLAFNSRMIRLGLSSADRALILGHDVLTNERIYSITDKRRLNRIRDILAG